MQILRPYPIPTESETLGVEPTHWLFHSPFGEFSSTLNFKKHCSNIYDSTSLSTISMYHYYGT